MRTRIFSIALLALVVIMGIVFAMEYKKRQAIIPEYALEIRDIEVFVRIADTEKTRARGLSGTSSLADNEGMLFLFEASDLHGIWMKDMNFPIDILWMDEEWKIVSIKENATPESYPEIFAPDQPSRYVLEVNAGFVKQNNIQIGETISPIF